MESVQEQYECVCGKVFDNIHAFTGHKGHCRKFLGEERYQNDVQRLKEIQSLAKAARHEQSLLQKEIAKEQWISEQHMCENCGKIMTEKYGSGRFCSSQCAHARNHTDESRLKTSFSLREFFSSNENSKCNLYKNFDNFILEIKELYLNGIATFRNLKYYELDKVHGVDFVVCPYCGARFAQIQSCHLKTHNKTMQDLKNDFGNNYQIVSEVSHKKKSDSSKSVQDELVKNGQHKGWQSRNIRSYAELFWEKVLDNNNIKYDTEYTVSKKELGLNEQGSYFLDFLIDGYIDVEIDGKQHTHEDRMAHDIKRDDVLNNNGFLVYRIPWINPVEKELVTKQIEDFIDWYKSVKNENKEYKKCL